MTETEDISRKSAQST